MESELWCQVFYSLRCEVLCCVVVDVWFCFEIFGLDLSVFWFSSAVLVGGLCKDWIFVVVALGPGCGLRLQQIGGDLLLVWPALSWDCVGDSQKSQPMG